MNWKIFWLIVAFFIIGGIIGWLLKPVQYIPGKSTHSRDTTYFEVPRPSDSASGKGTVKWKIRHDTSFIYIKDSLLFARVFDGDSGVDWDSVLISETNHYILTKPFATHRKDTVRKDTLTYGYHFPENYLWSNIDFGPDSIMTIHDSITVPFEIKEGWYVKPAYIGGSIIVGILLGLIIK